MRGETTIGDDERGQSDVLGVALITALVVVGTVGIVALGSGVLSGAQVDAQIESAEQAMTKLDATAALVALGQSDTQRASVSLRGIDEQLNVHPSEGWMNVTIVNRSTGEYKSTVMNRTLGEITYENGDTKIAYQGGGVWKKVEGGSLMVSPPEFHYRGNTLTLPLITVENEGDGVYSGDLTLKSTETRDQRFPNKSEGYSNPLPEEKQVNVTVHSEYYDAWGRFFAQRTDGEVTYDHPNNTVVVELVVPEEFPFDAPVIGTEEGQIDANGCSAGTGADKEDCDEFYSYGDYPSADEEIEAQIEDCEDGNCKTQDASNELDGGATYYFDSGLSEDDITIDTAVGDVTLVVNGDADLKNINVEGSNDVKIYVKGDVTIGGGGEINYPDGNSPDQFVTYIHSSGDFKWDGKAFFKGLIYAPESHGDINGQGNGEFIGSIVIGTGDLNGLPAQTYTFPESFELGLGGPDLAYVNYLYVSSIELQVNGS